ncbi:hypothetical protein Ddye_009730 [Dipteronia dyeriana]|uniref:Uncharacterized protein n=1 Tax=Dipteronia dyeriana TaxID=168575 RepID=A0AAD9XCZ2_9ROSI|nr:hypothetical protein Ddye_009730 [Dipteronia dyeriana]
MTNSLRDSLKTAEGDWYEDKLTRHNHLDALGHIDDALNRVPAEFADEDRHRFIASCFGHFLTMHREMKFSGGIIHMLLLRELQHDGPTDEMQFMLGKHSVRFSKVEFYLITGLRFRVIPDTTKYAAAENGIHQRYFPRADEVLMGVDERFKIPVWQFRQVGDLDAFPWGAHVYRHSIHSFKHALDDRRDGFERRQQDKDADVHTVESYNIYSLSYALLLAKESGGRRVTDLTPRILKWELTKQSRGKKLAKIFKARAPWAEMLNDVREALRKSEEDR